MPCQRIPWTNRSPRRCKRLLTRITRDRQDPTPSLDSSHRTALLAKCSYPPATLWTDWREWTPQSLKPFPPPASSADDLAPNSLRHEATREATQDHACPSMGSAPKLCHLAHPPKVLFEKLKKVTICPQRTYNLHGFVNIWKHSSYMC